MRIKILRKPPESVRLEDFDFRWLEAGQVCEVGSQLGALMLAEGWAEPADAGSPSGELAETTKIESRSIDDVS